MGKVNAVINVMTVSNGTVKQVNLYDSSEDIDKKKEFTYAGAVCYAAITEDTSSDDYKDYYSGWTYNAANGVQQHVLTEAPSGPVAFSMFNWTWANYESATGYNHVTLTSFNNTSALPNARQLSGVNNAANAFFNCQYLTDISSFVNLTAYGSSVNFSRMFQNNYNVANWSALNSWSTNNVSNMSYMFLNCTNMTNTAAMSGWNTSSVTNMGGMYYLCGSLNNISGLSGFKTNSVTLMSAMFNGCGIANLNALGGWNTGKVTNFVNMFCNCKSLSNARNIYSWNTSSATIMFGMFSNCTSITNANMGSSWNTAAVINMANMFSYCNAITTARNINGWNTAKVTNMTSMFQNCTALTNANMASSWNMSAVTNASAMFMNCNSITAVQLPDTFASSANCNAVNMFRNCKKLQGNIFFNGAYVNNATNCFYGANTYSKNIIANRSVSGGTYNSFYTAMGSSKTNSTYWNATLYPLDPGLTINPTPSNATVTIAGSTRSSYNAAWGETVSWEVSANSYVTQSGTQTMYDDTTLDVALNGIMVSVTVNPTPSDAYVTICETDTRGVTSCNEKSSGSVTRYATAGNLIEWTVEKDGYKTQTGSFTIYEDTVIDVELKLDKVTLSFTTTSAMYAAMTRVTVNGQVGDGTREYGIPSFTFDGGTFVYWTVEVYGQSGFQGYRTTGALILNSDTSIATQNMINKTHGTLNGAAVVYKDSVTGGYYTCSAAKWLEDSSYDVNAGRFSLCGVLVGDGSDEMVVAPTEQSNLAWGEDGDTGGVMTTSQDTARADMAGKDNTSKGYSSELCLATAFAIGWVTDSFSGGDTGSGWWLPSDGECVFVNKQLSDLNSVLSSIGTQITTSSIRSMTPYWTSTQYSAESSWSFYFDLGSELGDTDRANRAIARPVSRLSSGVGSWIMIDE